MVFFLVSSPLDLALFTFCVCVCVPINVVSCELLQFISAQCVFVWQSFGRKIFIKIVSVSGEMAKWKVLHKNHFNRGIIDRIDKSRRFLSMTCGVCHWACVCGRHMCNLHKVIFIFFYLFRQRLWFCDRRPGVRLWVLCMAVLTHCRCHKQKSIVRPKNPYTKSDEKRFIIAKIFESGRTKQKKKKNNCYNQTHSHSQLRETKKTRARRTHNLSESIKDRWVLFSLCLALRIRLLMDLWQRWAKIAMCDESK